MVQYLKNVLICFVSFLVLINMNFSLELCVCALLVYDGRTQQVKHTSRNLSCLFQSHAFFFRGLLRVPSESSRTFFRSPPPQKKNPKQTNKIKQNQTKKHFKTFASGVDEMNEAQDCSGTAEAFCQRRSPFKVNPSPQVELGAVTVPLTKEF